MRKLLPYLLFAGLMFGFDYSSAQEKLNVIQQAMRDEMERNLKDLKADGFDRPFFINYTLQDETIYQMKASLGAISNSFEVKTRGAISVRMLVGDYEFNDESLDNNLFSQPQANEINLPLDDDYLGIRRSLWISTDNVYRNASRQFAKNKELLKEQGKPLSELPHRRFAKVAPSKIDITAPEVKFDKGATEAYIRKVSAVFNDFAAIEYSYVFFRYQDGYQYLVNSEGSVNRVPVRSAVLMVTAMLRTPEGKSMITSFTLDSDTPELPPVETVVARAKHLAEDIVKSSALPMFRDEYSGPVLFEAEQLANLLYREMFRTESALIATNNIAGLKGYQYESNLLDSKIGKPLFAEGMTVKATPKMKKFGDVTLLGSYEVDHEGVIPADETVLVENGVLRQMCNDRTLVRPDQVANGMADGPGVVSISFKNTSPLSDMKAKLIEKAKKEGLDYGIKVSLGKNNTAVMNVYKVYVADGREELVRHAKMTDLSLRDFKKIAEASKELAAYHIEYGDKGVSMICPQAVIFEEIEIAGSDLPTFKEEEYVASPLKK